MKKIFTFFIFLLTLVVFAACESSTTSVTTSLATTTTSQTTASTTTKRPESQNTDPIYLPEAKGCEGVTGHDGWTPVWCDEFSINGYASAENWNFETGGGGWGNNEVQVYTARDGGNAYVQDGYLTITAKKNANGAFTSARMVTSGKYSFKYGRVDVKAKLPSAGGSWPAIWMMPQRSVYGSWPNSGEIDIMEHIGNNLNGIMASIHTNKYVHSKNTQISSGYTFPNRTASTEFHEYSIVWDEEGITWYVDNVQYFTTVGNSKLKPEANTDGEPYQAWPFHQEFFIILNIAVGGNMGGNVSPLFIEDSMVVDYVRVSKKDYVTNDESAPTAVENLRVIKSFQQTAYIAWDRAEDDMKIKGYNVYVNGKYKNFTADNYLKLTNLILDEYTIDVEAVDYAGNVSDLSTIIYSRRVKANGKLEAENYFSQTGTTTKTCNDLLGGSAVSFTDSDITTYLIKVEETTDCKILLRLLSSKYGYVNLYLGNEYLGSVEFEGNGTKWFSEYLENVHLEPGNYQLKVEALSGTFDLNYISFVANE